MIRIISSIWCLFLFTQIGHSQIKVHENPTSNKPIEVNFGTDNEKQITILKAHAPEIFQGEDGQWYISSVVYPDMGVSVDKLEWIESKKQVVLNKNYYKITLMMFFKRALSLFIILIAIHPIIAQEVDMEALKARKEMLKIDLKKWQLDIAEAQKEADKVAKEIKYLEDSLKVYPIWSKGVFGTLGFNFTRFQDWLSKNESNTAASNLGFTLNAFYNLQEKKYFWNTTLNSNQNWIRFDNKEVEEEKNGYQVASDAFRVSSLWGYKFSEKLAASALVEYRTALLQKRWNNPGFLDVGIGTSWTPRKDMVISIHPLNYNAVFSNSEADLNSSFGLKVIGEYTTQFPGGINWNTSLSSFFSYKSGQLNNWIWSNGLSKTIKKVGIGLDIAFKQNRQEAKTRELENNPFQLYYILGLSYKF